MSVISGGSVCISTTAKVERQKDNLRFHVPGFLHGLIGTSHLELVLFCRFMRHFSSDYFRGGHCLSRR